MGGPRSCSFLSVSRNICYSDDFETLLPSDSLGTGSNYVSVTSPLCDNQAEFTAIASLAGVADAAAKSTNILASIASNLQSAASIPLAVQDDFAPLVLQDAVAFSHAAFDCDSDSAVTVFPQLHCTPQRSDIIASSSQSDAAMTTLSCSQFACTLRTHFSNRTRFQRISHAFHFWHHSCRIQRRLFSKLHRIALMRHKAVMSSTFVCWTIFVADTAYQNAKTTSKLQQVQLLGLDNILSKCRIYFATRFNFRVVSKQFALWSLITRRKLLLKIRIARLTSKRARSRVLDFFFIWGTFVTEHKRQVAESAFAVIQQEQIRRSQNALEHCRLYFSDRLHHQDEVSLVRQAFAEWSKRARALRRASAIAKKFLFRCLNLQVSRAFFSWMQILNIRSNKLKVDEMIVSAKRRIVLVAFTDWDSITRIQKATRQVHIGRSMHMPPSFRSCR